MRAPRHFMYTVCMLVRGACLLLVLVLGAPCVHGAPTWTSIRLARAEPAELKDLQSPLHEHERRATGRRIRIAGEEFTFEEVPDGMAVWTRVSSNAKKDKRTRTGRFRVPGYLYLSTGMEGAYVLRFRRVGGLVLSSAVGLRLPVAKAHGFLVDSDLDGVFGSEGDGYVAPNSRTVGPFSGETWGAKGGVRYRKTADGRWQQAAIDLPHPRSRDHCATWSLVQWRRQMCGCLPLRYDRELEAGMRKHAAYLARNGGPAHSEDPKLPGFTPEGLRAAQNCIIGHNEQSMLSAMQMHFATLYHRTRPLQPGLMATAMVFHKGTFLFDVFSKRGGPLRDAHLVYPPHGMTGVPVRFHDQGEHPMPVSGVQGEGNRLGTAVNVFAEPLRLLTSLPAEPRITLERAQRRRRRSGGRVEAHRHYPGNPPNERAGPSNRGNVALVPAAALKERTRYVAFVRIPRGEGGAWTYRWEFETGRRATGARRRR